MADGAYAVPSLANPVSIDPAFNDARSDFMEDTKIGKVGGAFVDYWGGIWDIMTGNDEIEKQDLVTGEKTTLQAQSGAAPGSGDFTYFLMFAGALAALFYMKKGGL
jgi:hypothetical protein